MRRQDVVGRSGFRALRSGKKAKPTVESVEQRVLLTTFIVTSTSDAIAPMGQAPTPGTLRTAILQANADTAGPTIISFNIAATGTVQTISPTQPLPAITLPMTIDGTTEPLSFGRPLIEISGAAAGTGTTGLTISAGNTTVRGLTINRFGGNGIALTTNSGNTITGNYIGTNSTGFVAAANGLDGIVVQANSNTNSIINNTISGNLSNGINLNGTAGGTSTSTTSGNIIALNRIGTNSAGSTIVANGANGINVVNAPTTSIGVGGRNVIAGNRNGIELFGNSSGTLVQSNYIGVASDGATALGNGPAGTLAGGTVTTGSGIVLHGITDSTIGGAGVGNVISGNANSGIFAFGGGSSGITIQGNRIGTDFNGSAALGNSGAGINLGGSTGVTIGGNSVLTRNVISGNAGSGISSAGLDLVVQGNYIGVGTNGTTALGNTGPGIITVSGAVIGETIANATANTLTGAANIIANNSLGVQVTGGGLGNAILSNSIYGNTGVGIQNSSESAPTLATAVSRTGSSTYTGTLNNTTAGTYVLQFFSTPRPSNDPIQGRTLIGSVTITSPGGAYDFSADVPAEFLPGSYITATATRSVDTDPNSTSPFSTDLIVGTGTGLGTANPVITVTTSPTTVAAGDNVTYTFRIANPGTVAAQGVSFSDTIPASATFFTGSTSTGAPVVVTNGVAIANIGTIAPRSSVTVTIVLTTGGGSAPSFVNTGVVSSTVPTVTPADMDQVSATVTVTANSDLGVSVVGPPSSVAIGDNITYLVTVSNNGPSDATGVVLTNTLPVGTTFVSATSTVGAVPTVSGNIVTAQIGTLAAGAVANIVITVSTSPATPAFVTDSASVTGDQADGDPSNNSAISQPTNVVPSADLFVGSETAVPGNVIAGQPVTFTIIVGNDGPSTATGVTVVDTLPAGLTFLSGTADGGQVSFANGVIVAPVGTIAANGRSTVTLILMTTAAGTFTDSVVVSASEGDPDPTNNTSNASVTAVSISDLAVAFAAPTGTGNVGDPLTFTATVTNNGPSPATNVQFVAPLPDGFAFVSGGSYIASQPDALAMVVLVNGNIVAGFQSLAPGASEQLRFALAPTRAGTLTLTGSVSGNETDPDPVNNTASVSITAVIPSPILAFDMAITSVNENAGTATILLNRIGSTGTQVSARFSTIAGGNATPGLDYQPVSTIVTFPVGVSQIAVTVPVLANPSDRLNELVALQLDQPMGGAVFANGATSVTATLQIINLDPDLIGPKVTDLKLFGPSNSITAIEVDTDGGLDQTTATLAANYSFIAMGGTGAGALPAGTVIPASLAVYDPNTGAVLVFPSMALPSNELFVIVVNGTSGMPVTDIAGNPLNSVLGTTAGSDYVLTVARGTNLNYADENGTQVHLRLTGPGTLDINRTIGGQVGRLQILGSGNKTVLTGSVNPGNRRTTIGVILGFGQFGVVKTRLKTPPFYVGSRAFANSASLVGPPAVDVLLPTAATATAASTKKTRAQLKIKATARAQHPHAAVAHAAHSRSTR